MFADEPFFSECQPNTGAAEIRQGDIFRWKEISADPWRRVGLIITADCDIVHQKHRGILSYVPILDLKSFLHAFHLPAELQRVTTKIREELFKKIRQQQANLSPDDSAITDIALHDWLLEASSAEVTATLKLEDKKLRETITELVDAYQLANNATTADYPQLYSAIVALRSRSGASEAKFKESLYSRIKDLPGDFFFLRSLGSDHQDCYIACLRSIREVPEQAIAINMPALAESQALRFARLSTPYIYCLTQRLGNVFSDIGLPSRYEDARKEAMKFI